MLLFVVSGLGSIIISFICSIIESAFLSFKMSDLEIISEKKPAVGRSLKNLKENMTKSISSVLILNTFANTLGAVGVGAASKNVFHGDMSIFIASTLFTLLVLYFSEIIPKTIGATFYKELAPIVSYTLRFIIIITYPFTILSVTVMKIFDIKKTNRITREDILATTYLGEDSGVVGGMETNVISNILHANKNKVGTVTTPRSVVFAVSKDTILSDAMKNHLAEFNRFSRIPLFDVTIDNVVGIVHSKHLFLSLNEDPKNSKLKLEKFMSPVHKVNENIPVLKVMELLIHKKEHLFIVVDKYEQTDGVVTLEDCIESILGMEIMDETDTVEDMQELAKDKLKDRKTRLRAKLKSKMK